MQVARDKTTFHVLNGLRGVAAIAVVNTHLQTYFNGYYPHSVGLAVDFFFVLSGFVLAHAYEARLRSELGPWKFMVARLIRLYPLYLVGLLIGAVVCWVFWRWAGVPKFWTTFGFGLFMLPPPPAMSSNDHDLFPFNFAAWSLFFELIANLVYGLIARRLGNRTLGAIIVLSFLGLIAVGLTAGNLDQGVRPMQFLGGLARVMFSFFVGVALYRLWLRRPVRFSVHPAALFVLLVLPLLMPPPGDWRWVYELAVIAIYFPILVAIGAASQGGKAWKWIATALGVISYPIYVLHVPIWGAIRSQHDYGVDKQLIAIAPWSGLVFIAGLIVVSWCADKYFDYPLRRALSRRLLGRPTNAARPPPTS